MMYIIGVALVLLFFYFIHSTEERDKLKLNSFVFWCTTEYDHIRDNMSLWLYVYNASRRMNVDNKYKLSNEDHAYIDDILKEFQLSLNYQFKHNELASNKWVSSLSPEEYFFLSLYLFLGKKCDFTEISHEKLYLASTHYCDNNRKLQKRIVALPNEEDQIKERIDAKLNNLKKIKQ